LRNFQVDISITLAISIIDNDGNLVKWDYSICHTSGWRITLDVLAMRRDWCEPRTSFCFPTRITPKLDDLILSLQKLPMEIERSVESKDFVEWPNISE
jgi:hypothetical protein